MLDEVNPFTSAYTLEVSSPGPERPLRKLEHFQAAVGKMAKIKTAEPVDGRKNFTGTIKDASRDEVEIVLDEGKKGEEPRVQIPFELINSANLKPEEDW